MTTSVRVINPATHVYVGTWDMTTVPRKGELLVIGDHDVVYVVTSEPMYFLRVSVPGWVVLMAAPDGRNLMDIMG